MKQCKLIIDKDGWIEEQIYPLLTIRFKYNTFAYCVFWSPGGQNYIFHSYRYYCAFKAIEGL